jgi:2'-5' RNA ligase
MRLFAAIQPPENVLHHLGDAVAQLAPFASHRSPVMPRENWHVTLAFYGDLPDGAAPGIAADLRETALRHAPLTLSLSGAGTFRRSVAWIGIGGETAALTRLMKDLAPPDADRERMRGHLTIARGLRGRLGPDWEALTKAMAIYRGPEWTADEIVLMRSDLGQGRGGRSLYTPIASAVLEG